MMRMMILKMMMVVVVVVRKKLMVVLMNHQLAVMVVMVVRRLVVLLLGMRMGRLCATTSICFVAPVYSCSSTPTTETASAKSPTSPIPKI